MVRHQRLLHKARQAAEDAVREEANKHNDHMNKPGSSVRAQGMSFRDPTPQKLKTSKCQNLQAALSTEGRGL